jgi:hypothetical protein
MVNKVLKRSDVLIIVSSSKIKKETPFRFLLITEWNKSVPTGHLLHLKLLPLIRLIFHGYYLELLIFFPFLV